MKRAAIFICTPLAPAVPCRARRAGPPIIEVIGDADRIRRILDGSKDGRLQFFAGGIRVRGDLKYLSELSHEMGFIKEPFWPESK